MRLEKETLEKVRTGGMDTNRLKDLMRSIFALVHILIMLAALNVYLYRHHTLGEYPTSAVRYDDTFPMVVKFKELCDLLERGLAMTKIHSLDLDRIVRSK